MFMCNKILISKCQIFIKKGVNEGVSAVKTVLKISKKVILVFICIFILWIFAGVLCNYYETIYPIKKLERLPNANYITEIVKLKDEGKLEEALSLAKFVKEHPDMPGQEDAAVLEAEIEQKLHSKSYIVRQFAKGAITGSADTSAGMFGAIASDLSIYGDVRDVLVQGYKYVTGKEADPFVAVLAGVGVLTSVSLHIDVVPTLLKEFKKAKVLSSEFIEVILKVCRDAIKHNEVTEDLKYLFTNIFDVYKKLGFTRSKYLIRTVDSSDDVALAAKLLKDIPDEVFVLAYKNPDLIRNIRNVSYKTDDMEYILKIGAKKGDAGLKYLNKLNKPLFKYSRILAKDIKLGRFNTAFIKDILLNFIKKVPYIIYVVWFVLIITIWYLIKTIVDIYILFPRKKRQISIS